MLQGLGSSAMQGVMARATLLVNHVIASEPVAMARLRAHTGATLRVEAAGWPTLLPAVPDMTLRVSPAGLFEWLEIEDDPAVPDLRIQVDASNPLGALGQLAAGARPRIDVAGSAALAADVNWLIDNLRWDVQDDLDTLIGPAAAHAVVLVARSVGAALRGGAQRMASLADRGLSRDPGASPAR